MRLQYRIAAAAGGRGWRRASLGSGDIVRAMSRSRAHARGPLAGFALASALVVVGSLVGLAGALAYLLPPLLLVAALLLRRYPGERALLALMARAHRRARRRAPHIAMPCLPRAVAPPRGARLLAFSLAVRPPPARLAGSSG
jgi:hypothetical protein